VTSLPGPDDAFGGGGFDMGGLLEQALEMQRQMVEAQAALSDTEVVGEAGGGLVRVTLTGQFEVLGVHIDPAAVDPDDLDLLADLVTAALRNAMDGVLRLQTERMGTGLPDIGGLLDDLGAIGGIDIGAIGTGDPHGGAEVADGDDR
jgi:DNA-binding YbaB/EbfC family protein